MGVMLEPRADLTNTPKHCGSWLASDGGRSVNIMVTDTSLSLASQLPQGLLLDRASVADARLIGFSQ